MANLKKIMMASAGGDTQWALQIKNGDDSSFTGVAPNDDGSNYGIVMNGRSWSGSTQYVNFLQVDTDGNDVGPYKVLGGSTQIDGAMGRPVRYGRDRWWFARYYQKNTDARLWGWSSSAPLGTAYRQLNSLPTGSYDPIGVELQGQRLYYGKDDSQSIMGGEKDATGGTWYADGARFSDTSAGVAMDIVKSPSDGAVYALKVSNNQNVNIGKMPVLASTWPPGHPTNTGSWNMGYTASAVGYAFYKQRPASLTVKFGASSGYVYACGGHRIIRLNTNGDNTTTALSFSSRWSFSNSPQNQYSNGRIKYDNVNNKLYWIGNQNATTGDYVTIVQMDDDGVVLGSVKINSNTTNYSEMRVTGGDSSYKNVGDFFITDNGALVFGMTLKKTSGNSLRSLVVKCNFDNLSSLAGITDSDGAEMIASVSNPGCVKQAEATLSPSYNAAMGAVNAVGVTQATGNASTAYAPTLKNIPI